MPQQAFLQALRELGSFLGNKLETLGSAIKTNKPDLSEANRRLEQVRDEVRDQRKDIREVIIDSGAQFQVAINALMRATENLRSSIEGKEFRADTLNVSNTMEISEEEKEEKRMRHQELVAEIRQQADVLQRIAEKSADPVDFTATNALITQLIETVKQNSTIVEATDFSSLEDKLEGLRETMDKKNNSVLETKLDKLSDMISTFADSIKNIKFPSTFKLDEMQLKSLRGGAVLGGVVSSSGEHYSSMKDNTRSVATAGTAVQLSATNTLCEKVEITAKINNVGFIVVGGSTVVAAQATRRGTPLAQGDTMTLYVDNLSKIYLDAENSGDGVTYVFYS